MDLKNEGLANFREFGGYPTSTGSNATTRGGFLYRSSHLANITASGWKLIKDLKISIIICLAAADETASLYGQQEHTPDEIENIKIIEVPFHMTRFSVKEVLRKYIEYESRGPIAVAKGYLDLLRENPSVIKKIFLQIYAHPDAVFLIHCSMGKDRTGVVFALLFAVAGVPYDLIAMEYALSEKALEPWLPDISQLVQQTMPPDAGDLEINAIARQMINSSEEAMLHTLQMIENEFGGVAEYLKQQCGLSSENIEHVRVILTQKS